MKTSTNHFLFSQREPWNESRIVKLKEEKRNSRLEMFFSVNDFWLLLTLRFTKLNLTYFSLGEKKMSFWNLKNAFKKKGISFLTIKELIQISTQKLYGRKSSMS